jgi:hypothetical protein
MVNMLLIFLSVLGADGITPTTTERCEIVHAALDDASSRTPPLAMEPCVLENNYRDGSVLVDAVTVRRKGSKEVRTTFLMHGEYCGTDLIPVSLHRLPRGIGEPIHVLMIELRPQAKGRLLFEAWLHIYDPSDPNERKGTIGIACGAANEGVIEKQDGHWVALARKDSPNPSENKKWDHGAKRRPKLERRLFGAPSR